MLISWIAWVKSLCMTHVRVEGDFWADFFFILKDQLLALNFISFLKPLLHEGNAKFFLK